MYFIEIETARKSTATHRRPDGQWVYLIGHHEPKGLTAFGTVMSYPSLKDLEQDLGYEPRMEYEDFELVQEAEEHIRETGRVWRYWMTTPDGSLEGVRSFAAAAEAGGLPDDWTEQAAEDGSGTPHTVCSYTLTMDGARALGAEQEALTELASLPGDVHFFQTVAGIDGFTGVEKQSRHPTTLATTLYEPQDLFQTSHPDAADQRGSAFSEADVLSVTGLTLT